MYDGAVTRDERLDAFEAWLHANGAGDEANPVNRSTAAGILAVAGKGAVTAEHVAAGVALAHDAGMTETATMERIGAWLVAFEAGAPLPAIGAAAPVVEPPAAVVARPVVVEAPPVAEPPPALQISIRTSQLNPVTPDEVAAATPVPAKPRRPRTRKGPVLAAVATIAILGGAGAWWITRGDPEPPAPRVTAESTPLARIPELDLPVVFPEGWRVVHLGAGTALVARGSEHQAFVATVPLVTPLAAGMTPEALIAVAHDAEQGAAARLVSSAARYYSEGCEAAGAGVAVCRGTATLGGDVVTLQTYLRLGARRAVLAMFMAKPSVADAKPIAAAIVDSLVL